jgi:hypothetical protein
MSKEHPPIPAIEVRATFNPSERIRDVLQNLLDPGLDIKTKESLHATFLLKSWRRRVMDQEYYVNAEHEQDSAIRKATKSFEGLSKNPLKLRTEFKAQMPKNGSRMARFFFSPVPSAVAISTSNILTTIPSIEPLFEPQGTRQKIDYASLQNMVYTEIPLEMLGTPAHITSSFHNEQKKIAERPDLISHYSALSKGLAIRAISFSTEPIVSTPPKTLAELKERLDASTEPPLQESA